VWVNVKEWLGLHDDNTDNWITTVVVLLYPKERAIKKRLGLPCYACVLGGLKREKCTFLSKPGVND
jgi:hypothetical protein